MVRVILNADDFGKSAGRNRAINDSFEQGLIRSAGLIVTGKHLQEAIALMNKGGYVENVHLHVNLSTNLLHEDPEDIPLTEALKKDAFFCKDGKFRPDRGLLPRKISSIFKWKLVYKELVAQYDKFVEVTKGKGNGYHIDFHLWYNLTWSASIALNVFTRKYNIKSVRYIGLQQKSFYKLFRILSWNPRVKHIPSTNIDYFLTKQKTLSQKQIIELYCHPNYKDDGTFLDDSPSYFGHERQPMIKHIQKLRETGNIELVSWEDMN